MPRYTHIIILLIGLTLLNLISSVAFARLDLTEGQIHTLSNSTKKIAANLPHEVEIKVFLSKELPPQIVQASQSIKDKLDEYQIFSNRKIKVTYADPATDEKAKELAQYLQIPQIEAQIIEKDQLQFKKIYIGLAVLQPKDPQPEEDENAPPLAKYEKTEVIPVIQNLENFEYDLTEILLRYSSEEKKVVGFLKGHGEFEIIPANINPMFAQQQQSGYPLMEILSKNYDVRPVEFATDSADSETEDTAKNSADLTPETETPTMSADPKTPTELAGIDTLLIAGPKTAIPNEEAEKIQQFITAGGNVIFLADRVQVNDLMMVDVLDEDFSNILQPYGLTIEPKLIATQEASVASFQQQQGNFRSIVSMPYPYFNRITNINKDDSATSKIESFTLPWVSPITVNAIDGINIEVLARSSSKYELIEEKKEIITPDEPETANNSEEPIMSTEDSPPKETAEPAPEPQVNIAPINIDPYQKIIFSQQAKEALPVVVIAQKENQGKLVAVSDADFLSSNFLSNYQENLILFLNLVDSLTIGDTLIDIRSKGVTDRPIKELTETEKNFIRWINIIGIPLLVTAYGLGRKYSRKNRKKLLL